jgi:hypothetical protein
VNFLKAVFVGVIFLVPANAQELKTNSVSEFKNSHPTIKWSSKPVLADVLCDGNPATVIFGSENQNVIVAVISSAHPNKTQMFSFPIRSDTQDGFCALPNKIQFSALDCKTDEGPLPGCKRIRGCKAFSVNDDDCDSFNFYWDSSRRALAWWRH